MTSDLDLLRQYAQENSQDAFGEIVRRHLDLIYSAALRQVRSPQLAEEVTQSVFTDLARNAGKLKPDTTLTAWLYAVTRRTAIDMIRKESRRQLREQIATGMNTTNDISHFAKCEMESAWAGIEPLLDSAMTALDETDRSAILLRYFENKSLREVGEALGASEDAAQKRVSRAVEHLRDFFSQRNVTIGASGLAVLISANAVQSAPIGLVLTISTAALAGATVSTSAAIAVTKTFAMTTLQKTLIAATFTAAVGAGIFEAHQASQLREQNQTLQQQQAPLAEQVQQLQEQHNMDSNTISRLNEELADNEKNNSELLTLRGQVGSLRSRLKDATMAATRTRPTVASSGVADVGDQNQAMFDFLGSPVLPPPNLDFAYTKQGLINAVQSAAQSANITLAKVVIDDSEFPCLVGVLFQNKGDDEKLKGELRKLADYNYSGSVSGDGAAAMNIIPYNSYPADARQSILNRRQVREAMLYQKITAQQ